MTSFPSSFLDRGLEVDGTPEGFMTGFTRLLSSVGANLGAWEDDCRVEGRRLEVCLLELDALECGSVEERTSGGEAVKSSCFLTGFRVVHLAGLV